MASKLTETRCSSILPVADQTSNDVTNYSDLKEHAARAIQKAYRTHRIRREFQGLTLAAPAARTQATAEADSRSSRVTELPRQKADPDCTSPARRHWQHAVNVAIQASADDDPLNEEDTDPHSGPICQTEPKMMDLQYFLEMVDTKHRHGSNLRAYHTVWSKSASKENFFYWLDYGEGKAVDLPQCPRDRLEKEQVRYLSPEERFNYLVKIDDAGRFRWAKNDELVDTDDKRYKDSLHGVVQIDEDAPRFRGYPTQGETEVDLESTSGGSSPVERGFEDEEEDEEEEEEEAKMPVKTPHEAPTKPAHSTPAAMYDHFADSLSVKKGTWLFVADSSYRIYVGIKEPGTFQHSSFLRGGRISAAGMLRIRHGQLRSLAPLSGHYRPNLANFRAFHHSLQNRGVDLSHVWISKSYATLAGIEGYVSTKRKMRRAHEKLEEAREKLHLTHLDGPRSQHESCDCGDFREPNS